MDDFELLETDKLFMNSQKQKSDFINLLRGLAIFLMLWGHCIQYCCGGQFDFFEDNVFKAIYSFHMPLFMVISGYLFHFSAQKRKLVELIQYKAKSLLYPILMGNVVNFVLILPFVLMIRRENNLGLQLDGLWFLWSVLSASVVLSFAVKCKNKVIQFLLIILGLAAVALFPCREMNIWMYPYFVVGWMLAGNSRFCFAKLTNIIGLVSTICFVVMLLFFAKKYYIYTSGIFGGRMLIESLQIDFYRWFVGFFGSATVVWAFSLAYKRFNGCLLDVFLQLLGKNSLSIYILQSSLLSFYLPVIARNLLKHVSWINWNEYILAYWVITFVVAFLYSLLILKIVKLLKKNNVHALIFGR